MVRAAASDTCQLPLGTQVFSGFQTIDAVTFTATITGRT